MHTNHPRPAHFVFTAMATALALLPVPAAAVNKCIWPGGQITFQDAPCVGKGEALTVRPASGDVNVNVNVNASSEQSAERTRREIAVINRRSEVNQAIARGEPLVGMSRAELDQAMGAPTRVNADNDGGVMKSQIICERPQATWLVYAEADVVTRLQNRPTIGRSAAAPAVHCPTPFEIRNMQTGASSSSLSGLSGKSKSPKQCAADDNKSNNPANRPTSSAELSAPLTTKQTLWGRIPIKPHQIDQLLGAAAQAIEIAYLSSSTQNVTEPRSLHQHEP